MHDQVVPPLRDPAKPLLVIVSQAESMSFAEAPRPSLEQGELGLQNQHLIINGVFSSHSDDPIAQAFAEKPILAVHSLPEATPTHETSALQDDLRRAGIERYGWIVNRSFAFSGTQDPVLCAKSRDELCYIDEILDRHAQRAVISPWVPQELNGSENLKNLITDRIGGQI